MKNNNKKAIIFNTLFRLSVCLFLLSPTACPNNSTSNVNLVTEKGTGVIKGIIVGSDAGLSISAEGDKPISDANVFLDDLPDFKTRTNADGSFEMKNIPNGEHFIVAEKTTNKGTIKARSAVTISKAIPIVDVKSLVVRKTGSIQGLIKLEEGSENSLLGIDVFIGGSNLVSKTKENGAYALINVAEGTYNVTSSQAGYEKKTMQIEVKAGKASNLDFTLKKDTNNKFSNIDATVLTETTLGNKPLEGVIVSINELGVVSVSDESGKISLSNVVKGTHKLRVYKLGYKLKIIEQKIEDNSKTINFGNINLELENKSVLSGKIINEKDKTPIEGVKVNFGPKFVYTSVNGRFLLENIEQGEYTLEFSKGDKTKDDCSKGGIYEQNKKDVLVQSGKTTDTFVEMKEVSCDNQIVSPIPLVTIPPSSNISPTPEVSSSLTGTPVPVNSSSPVPDIKITPTPNPIATPTATILPSLAPTPIPTPVPTSIPIVNRTVTTIAGNSDLLFGDGLGLRYFYGIAVDNSENIYVADSSNSLIRKITSSLSFSTFAGNVSFGVGVKGYADGIGTASRFDNPHGIALDSSGNIYVADSVNNKIRKITPTGLVSTLAGSSQGFADGSGSNAQFDYPTALAVDSSGNIFVAEQSDKIRKITPSGIVSTFANGSTSSTKFTLPWGLTIDSSGNVFVADSINHRIVKINSSGVVSLLAGSSQGFADGVGSAAQFNGPKGLAVDNAGNVFVADYNNHKIRKITSSGVVTTIAGTSAGFADGSGSTAQFNYPSAVALNSSGSIFVADTANSKIRKIQ